MGLPSGLGVGLWLMCILLPRCCLVLNHTCSLYHFTIQGCITCHGTQSMCAWHSVQMPMTGGSFSWFCAATSWNFRCQCGCQSTKGKWIWALLLSKSQPLDCLPQQIDTCSAKLATGSHIQSGHHTVQDRGHRRAEFSVSFGSVTSHQCLPHLQQCFSLPFQPPTPSSPQLSPSKAASCLLFKKKRKNKNLTTLIREPEKMTFV